MEQLMWLGVEGINRFLSWLTQVLEGIMPGREVHFWAIGLLGMFFFVFSYVIVKIFRKIPFGDTALAFIMGLTFVSGAVLATGMDDVAAQMGVGVLSEGAAGITGFLILFILYSIVIFVIYAGVKAVKKAIQRKKEAKLIDGSK